MRVSIIVLALVLLCAAGVVATSPLERLRSATRVAKETIDSIQQAVAEASHPSTSPSSITFPDPVCLALCAADNSKCQAECVLSDVGSDVHCLLECEKKAAECAAGCVIMDSDSDDSDVSTPTTPSTTEVSPVSVDSPSDVSFPDPVCLALCAADNSKCQAECVLSDLGSDVHCLLECEKKAAECAAECAIFEQAPEQPTSPASAGPSDVSWPDPLCLAECAATNGVCQAKCVLSDKMSDVHCLLECEKQAAICVAECAVYEQDDQPSTVVSTPDSSDVSFPDPVCLAACAATNAVCQTKCALDDVGSFGHCMEECIEAAAKCAAGCLISQSNSNDSPASIPSTLPTAEVSTVSVDSPSDVSFPDPVCLALCAADNSKCQAECVLSDVGSDVHCLLECEKKAAECAAECAIFEQAPSTATA